MALPINRGTNNPQPPIAGNQNPFIGNLQTLGLRIIAIYLVQKTIGLADPIGMVAIAGAIFASGCRERMLVHGEGLEQAIEGQTQATYEVVGRAFTALREGRIC